MVGGYALGLLANICYATNPLFSLPLLQAGIGVSSVLFCRYLLALPLYAFIAGYMKGISFALPRTALLPVATMALLFAGSSLALYSAFLYIDGGLACTLLFVYPAMVTLLSACFFGEKVSFRILLALLSTTTGIALLYRGGDAPLDIRGVAWALASAAFYALYILGVRHIRPVRELRAEVLTFYVMLISMGLFGVQLLATEGALQCPSSSLHWGCLLAIALIPTIVSLESFTRALHRIGAVRLSILGSAEPLVAIAIGVSIFGEALTLPLIIGVLLILSGIMLTIRR